MDLLTHGIVGLHVARLMPAGKLAPRAAAGVAVVASLAPDLDALLGLRGPGAFVLSPRPGHSLLALAVGAPLLALATALILRKPLRYWLAPMALLAAVCIAVHLALDACTPLGPSLFWPRSNARIALDWLYFFDGVLLLLLVLPLVRDFFRARAGRPVVPARSAATALVLGGLYVAICGNLHARARSAALEAAVAGGGESVEAEVRAYPVPFGPMLWTTAVRLGADAWQRGYVSAVTGGFTRAGTFVSGVDDARAQVALETAVGRAYASYAGALYLVSETAPAGDGSFEVVLGDLRFTGPFGSAAPHQLWIRVGPDFREVAHDLRTGRVDPDADSLAIRSP